MAAEAEQVSVHEEWTREAALARALDWAEGRRSWMNLGSPHAGGPYTPDVIAVMDAQEVVKWTALAAVLPEIVTMEQKEPSLEARAEALRQECRDFCEAAAAEGHFGGEGFPRSAVTCKPGCLVCEAAKDVRESRVPLDEHGLW